jgi:hypothetical protein
VEQKIKTGTGQNLNIKIMDKMLLNSNGGNLFEVLLMGRGQDYIQYKLELWDKEKNKWINSGIYFKTLKDVETEKVIEVAKEQIENSIYS